MADGSGRRRRIKLRGHLRQIGLRARITLAFGLGALLLSAVLAGVTWGLMREDLLRQREDAATRRVLTNARIVQQALGPETDVQEILLSLPTPEGTNPVLLVGGEWHATNPLEFAQNSLPRSLRESVSRGAPGLMRYELDGEPFLAVGVAIPGDQDVVYFEGAPLTDVEDVLGGLAISLLGAAAVTTTAGAALGFSASRRLLRPLADVGAAAHAIAEGSLETRLDVGGDPDLEQLEASFNEMVSALQSRIDRDTRFASDVSHELRSPLMTLSASLHVLENQRDEMPERAQTALDLLKDDIERFQQLVEDLLEISRVDAGAVRLQLEDVLAAEMARRAVGASARPDTPLDIAEDAADAVVLADKRRLGRAIANLLDNAEKYAGGPTRVEVTMSGPDRVHVAVEDDGAGVPIEERELVFDRFARGQNAAGMRGTDSGSGLGLSLVDEHVRLHGGRTWVEDRPDGHDGARFVIELPLAPEADDTAFDAEADDTAMEDEFA